MAKKSRAKAPKRLPAPASQRTSVTHSNSGIRAVLFNEIEKVINGETTPGRLGAVARASGVIISSHYLDLEVEKLKVRSNGRPPLEVSDNRHQTIQIQHGAN